MFLVITSQSFINHVNILQTKNHDLEAEIPIATIDAARFR